MSEHPQTQTVHIDFKPVSKGYDIVVGDKILGELGTLLRDRIGQRRCVIVTDHKIGELYLKRVEAVLAAAGHTVLPSVIVQPGETSKSLPGLHELMNHLFDRMIDRKTIIVALGGGVIGDLAGFAAAIALRGIDFIQVPTTLLAQVDSSVGGKTGINSVFGKNTVGAFHQPRLVVADVSTLDSLPEREMLSGYGEVVKYGLIMDPVFFDWCREHGGRLVHGDAGVRIHAVTKSCEYKAKIVADDEREAGARALLNLGHTFGHALESVTGYSDKLLHGEAVAIGTVLAFRLSAELGLCPTSDAQIVRDHFQSVGLPVAPPPAHYDVDQLMMLMAQDKKARAGKITLILARGIGQGFIAEDVDEAPVRTLWRKVIG